MLDRVLDAIEDCGVFLFMFTMFILIVAQVFFRYVLKYPFPWAEELARYCMIWGTFLGVSSCTKTKAHVGVDGLVNLLPKTPKKIINIIVILIVVILNISIFVLAVQLTANIYLRRQTSPAMVIPMWLAYFALPVGFGLSSIRSLRLMAGALKDAVGSQ